MTIPVLELLEVHRRFGAVGQIVLEELQEELFGFKSHRIKQYRLIYNLNDVEYLLRVYYIGLRRDVYEQFRQLLADFQKMSPPTSHDK